MKNSESWSPSKFIYKNNQLVASRDPGEVAVGSRLMADLIARFYDIYLKQYCRGKLIDLGCGKAPLYEAYKNLVETVICVDWSNASHGKTYLDFECDLSKKLPFQDQEFDTVILSDVLEHIAEPKELWQEMYRILRVNGKVLLNVPFFYWLHEIPHDYYRYTEFGLRHLAESTGFKVIELKAMGGMPEVLADIGAKFLQFRPFLGKPLANLVQVTTAQFIKTKLGKTLSERTGKIFPIAYFMIVEKP